LFNFDQLNIDKSFICCSGVSLHKGVTDYNLEEVETRRKILDISKHTYLTADSSKIDKIVTVKICDIATLDYFISDDHIETAKLNHFKDRSEEHTSELQSRFDLVCRLLLEKNK